MPAVERLRADRLIDIVGRSSRRRCAKTSPMKSPALALPKFWWAGGGSGALNQSSFYARMADALLGPGVRPFEGFFADRRPSDMKAKYWYGSVFATNHHDLARILLLTVRSSDAWVLEAGSFIGNSGTVWSLTARELGMNAAVVCIDTWLGDQIMWTQKGNALGPPGRDGQPRLYALV